MRYERKYETNYHILNELKIFLKSNSFEEHFPSRIVSSIYFDTNNFKNYLDAESGNSDRAKIRARFYDFNVHNISIEIKRKKSELGYKDYFNIKEIDKVSNMQPIFLKKSDAIFKLPKTIFSIYRPNIYVEYNRHYFISSDGALRITFDNSINFSRITNISNNFKIKKRFPYNSSVIELKYDANYLPSNKFLSNLFDRFNLTFSKFSKYCIAINSIY